MNVPDAEAPAIPAWPRLDASDTEEAVRFLLTASVSDATDRVSTDPSGCVFYATAQVRVDREVLESVRRSILEVATKHGFPHEPRARTRPTFDQDLARLVADTMPMLPVEAADPDVWEFLTLRVVPDVAVWRWPQAGDQSDDAEQSADPKASRIERLLGGRRGMLRQAWWRSYLLGTDACLELDEDNFIQLTDRISLTGEGRLARAIVAAHLEMKKDKGYHPRDGLRAALVSIGRIHGRLAVECLDESELRELVRTAFLREVTR